MKNIALLFLVLILSICVKAQEINLEDLISKAEKAATQYTLTFKNLSADELKTFVYFKKRWKN